MYTCTNCKSILDVTYDYDLVQLDKEKLSSRSERSIWRFRELLPIKQEIEPVSMGEGYTPIIHAKRLGQELGLKKLLLKDETRNPTGAFKDRALSTLITRAKQEKFSTVITASSGNASSAAAAYSSKAGFRCYVLFQDGSPAEKLLQTTLYGASGLAVRKLFAGTAEDLSGILRAVADNFHAYNIFCWALINPYALEGIKTISYEIAQSLDWLTPDFVVTPAAGGDNLAGQWKGYVEFEKLGLIKNLPKMVAVQPEGASPLVNSWRLKLNHVESIQAPNTVASGLRAAYSGDHGLKAIYDSEGCAIAISDKKIIDAERLLARLEGIWVEPSSATVVAALSELKEQGTIDSKDVILCTLTGGGFKDLGIAHELGTQPAVVDRDVAQILEALNRIHSER